MGLHTPLYDDHLSLNARMVPFGGWDMPLHYGSQLDEHLAVRARAGMFDVSHMRAVDVTGDGARDFLRRLLANDVARLQEPGKALYSCMLNPVGGVLDDLIVYFLVRTATGSWSTRRPPMRTWPGCKPRPTRPSTCGRGTTWP